MESVISGLEFPPGGEADFVVVKNWDRNLGALTYQQTFKDMKGGKAGLAINLFDVSFARN